MLKPRRRAALVVTAAATIASTVALALPAQAVTMPIWPSTGYIPTGCDTNITWTPTSPTAWTFNYTDSGTPHVTGVHIGTGAGSTSVVAPSGASLITQVFSTETCSGVANVILGLEYNGAVLIQTPTTPATTDAFHATSTYAMPVKPDNAGYYQVFATRVYRRYDAFTIDQDFRLTASTASVTSGIIDAGPWMAQKFYVLRATTLSNALSAAKVKKGKTVKATAQLKYATNTGYVVDAGDKVVVQTKVGTGKWVSNATLTTNSSGVVSYTFVLSATTQVRFIHNAVLSGKFTTGVASAIRTVKRA